MSVERFDKALARQPVPLHFEPLCEYQLPVDGATSHVCVLLELLRFTSCREAPFGLQAQLLPQSRVIGNILPAPVHLGTPGQAYRVQTGEYLRRNNAGKVGDQVAAVWQAVNVRLGDLE